MSHYEAARSILDGHIPVPRMVSFWPTTICNYNCSFCLYKRENTKEHKVADTESTMWMIDQIAAAGVRSLEFSGGGEPTLHPDFEIIAEYAYNRKLKLGLFTNGTNLHFDILKDFRYVRIGLDAADSEAYEWIKKPKVIDLAFDIVCKNIKRFVESKNSYKRPRIGVKFLLNRVNCTHIKKMVDLGIDLGADYVHFKRVHNGPSDMLTVDEEHHCEEWIKQERRIQNIDIYGSVQGQTDMVKCFMSPIHTVIDPTGDVFVCCFLRDKNHTIGNVFNRPLKDFWGKNRHQDILSRITANRCSQWDCRWRGYSAIMREVVVDDTLDIDFI